MWILGLKGLTGKIISASQFACFQLFQSTRDLRCPKLFRILGFSSTSIKLLPWHPIHTCQIKAVTTSGSCKNNIDVGGNVAIRFHPLISVYLLNLEDL